MLFNSFEFFVFLAIVLVCYRSLGHLNQNRVLLIASYFFYGAWDYRFLSVLILSTLVDYYVAFQISGTDANSKKKTWLLLSLFINLGLLAFFKYYGFFSREFAVFLKNIGIPVSIPYLNVILPVGISFYTFQKLSYIIDVYRKTTSPARDILDFALYVSFFPQILAGPIARASLLLPQIIFQRSQRSTDFQDGLYHVILGLFQKVVIADNMAIIVNTIFHSDPSYLTGSECLVGMYAFAFQIYGDFAGYSSIAKGVAKWLGFDLMTNFNGPYLSASPREFWHRWHISLSTWLRDYIFIPLGGSRGRRLTTYRNLMITMVLGGLWHGAAWTFILWGAFHGVLLAGQRWIEEAVLRRKIEEAPPLIRGAMVVVTFHLITLGWLLFRADSIEQAKVMTTLLATNFTVTSFAISSFSMILFYVSPLLVYEWWRANTSLVDQPTKTLNPLTNAATLSYCTVMLLLFAPPETHEFIYFQF